jgi:tetratricopeptide (TPR) repeat protein
LSEDPFQGFVFNPADLAEPTGLDLARRKVILFAEAHLESWTHWQVLGIPWNAPGSAARDAYLEKVKIFHPDRYPGQQLGSFRGRLERVFRRLTEARDGLVDEARRVAYARETAPVLERAKAEARRIEDERRSEERRARLSRSNPLLARAGRIAELMKRGREAMAAGRFGAAANDFQLVASLDPGHREAPALAEEARKKVASGRVAELVEKAQAAETMGRPGQAVALYREALEADPGSVRAAVLGVKAAVEAGDLAAARELGDAAVKAAPRTAAAHEALGLALEASGQKAEARKALERAVELDPRLESARERLKKLKGLLGFLR